MATSATSSTTLAQQNIIARNMVLASATEMIQKPSEAAGNFNPQSVNVITLKPILAGLTKGFYVDVIATIVNDSSNTLYLTEQGIAGIFSQIMVTDTNGLERITTDGFHIMLNNFQRFKTPLGSIDSITNSVGSFGSNFDTVSVPSSIAAGATVTATFTLYIPLAYAGNDLRGAIYTNVTGSGAMNIQLSINPYPISTVAATAAPVVSGVPPTTVYAGASAVNSTGTGAYISNINIVTRQVYLLNLPAWNSNFAPEFNQGGILLPIGDLSVYYQLWKSTALTSISAGNASPINYAPQRSYLSTNLVYNNGNELNNGSDISRIAIQGANQMIFLDATPKFLSMMVENDYHLDLPRGTYYINRRHSPINTINYGNMQIMFTPATVNAGAVVIAYDEYFSYSGITNTATSIS